MSGNKLLPKHVVLSWAAKNGVEDILEYLLVISSALLDYCPPIPMVFFRKKRVYGKNFENVVLW